MSLVTKYYFTEKNKIGKEDLNHHIHLFANALWVLILLFEHFTKWKYYHEKKKLLIKDKNFTIYFQGDNSHVHIAYHHGFYIYIHSAVI